MLERSLIRLLSLMVLWLLCGPVSAQDNWPVVIPANNGTLTVYQPQPESYKDGTVTARAAIAWQDRGKDPIYGAIWMNGFLEVDRDTRMGTLTKLVVTDAKFPTVTDTTQLTVVKEFLGEQLPKHTPLIAIDRLIASLETDNANKPEFKNDPPHIFFEETASTLVLFDGEPILQALEGTAYERVVNTPFMIAGTKDRKTYYLGSSTLWYTSAAVLGPWTVTTSVPQELQGQVKKDDEGAQEATLDANGKPIVPKIVVSTKPAELLQTDGTAKLQPIQGTQLLYVTNTDNDVFMDITSQQFYALLSGRWFAAAKLGPDGWNYIDADKLPADFAKIPEGSPKDGVLASVPGTAASKEAVLDASIPQTAKVDRTATTTVTYDGDPKWRLIEGTEIYEAENASTSVLFIKKRFYACDNAVWYESDDSMGPWKVCDKVPEEVKSIPPSSPNYNVTYVQVYESTPDVVYVGYTPGYTGCYVYGPTVIYGTGYAYQPWYGAVYYPPPVTYGFNMHYNPWTGWSMGMTASNGFMTVHVGGYPGGWWGPPMYRPPYHRPPYHYGGGGYYGRGGNNTVNIDNSTNINVGGGQGNRPGNAQGGGTRPDQRPAKTGNLYDKGKNTGVQPSRGGSASTQPTVPANKTVDAAKTTGATTRPATAPSAKPGAAGAGNNMYTDRSGNVYRDNGSSWQQQQGSGQFKDVKQGGAGGMPTTRPSGSTAKPSMSPSTQQQLNRDQQNRDRGQQRVNSYQSSPTHARPSPSAAPRSGGGARGVRR
ncbi:MAG: hypothetical protein WEC15_01595 [Flavobacteriales bacterium]